MGKGDRGATERDPAQRRLLARRLGGLTGRPFEREYAGDVQAPGRLHIVRELRALLPSVESPRQRAAMEMAALIMEQDHAYLTIRETPYGRMAIEDAVVLECLRHQGGTFTFVDLVSRYPGHNMQLLRKALWEMIKAQPKLLWAHGAEVHVAKNASALVGYTANKRTIMPLMPPDEPDDSA